MLIGNKIGIASVGISCQTENQIADHHVQIGRLAGDVLEHKGGPFDWVLAGTNSVASMIESGWFFPAEVDEIAADMVKFGYKKPYWRRFGVHFWHESADRWDDFTSKRGHLVANFDRFRDVARRVFIISNTQNNILRALSDREPIETRLFWGDIVDLSDVLQRRFGPSELHVVTRDGLDDPIRPNRPPIGPRPAITVHKIGRDGSQWAGNGRAWAKLFEQIIP